MTKTIILFKLLRYRHLNIAILSLFTSITAALVALNIGSNMHFSMSVTYFTIISHGQETLVNQFWLSHGLSA